jgi:hypothetical protein
MSIFEIVVLIVGTGLLILGASSGYALFKSALTMSDKEGDGVNVATFWGFGIIIWLAAYLVGIAATENDMNKFKSPWFFWYTGHKFIAVLSMFISAMIMWAVLVIGAGFSIWGIILAVLLDAIGLWVALIYMIALRDYIGDFDKTLHNLPLINHVDFISNLYLQDKIDGIVVTHFVIPLIISFFLSRLTSHLIAKICRYNKFA